MSIVKQGFQVAGTTFGNRQKYLAYLKHQKKTFRTTLVREPTNKHDPNAIQVMAKTDGKPTRMPLGYVPRELAEKLAPMMDKGKFIYVNGTEIVGGRPGYSYGALAP